MKKEEKEALLQKALEPITIKDAEEILDEMGHSSPEPLHVERRGVCLVKIQYSVSKLLRERGKKLNKRRKVHVSRNFGGGHTYIHHCHMCDCMPNYRRNMQNHET